MAAFATVQDVAARWRPLTSTESDVAEVLLEDASDIIRTRWSDVGARITAGTLAESSVIRVTANMVKRAMIVGSAEGFETYQQGSGPFSEGGKVANPNANLYLTAEDVRVFNVAPTARVGWLA